MNDLFSDEQLIYDQAINRAGDTQKGIPLSADDYSALAVEYGKLLKQLRRATRLSDRTTLGLHETNLDLENKAMFDALTGLYNRRYLDDTLNRNIKALSRAGDIISVLMLDVDYFKDYNDSYGHGAGDTCLKRIADTLAKCVSRAGDYVVRYGGEEFTIVLPHTDERGACGIARQALHNIRGLGIPHASSDVADFVTISIGITTVSAEHTHIGQEYIKRADEALYLSKQAGRNRYSFLKYWQKSQDTRRKTSL